MTVKRNPKTGRYTRVGEPQPGAMQQPGGSTPPPPPPDPGIIKRRDENLFRPSEQVTQNQTVSTGAPPAQANIRTMQRDAMEPSITPPQKLNANYTGALLGLGVLAAIFYFTQKK